LKHENDAILYLRLEQPSASASEKRTSVFLTCVGPEAYDVYRAMQFALDEDRKKIENVVTGF